MEAWGFTYKSQAVWVKHKAATGFWFRGQHELLFVGTKGKVPAPAPGDAWASIIEAAARKHSQKPDIVYELIESYFPNLPKIELNARGPARDGWETWGPECAP
jgi:N6-adenosine-specific RNA methylase IME4